MSYTVQSEMRSTNTRLVKKWKEISGGKPFLLKGIQDPDDAKKAMEMGCDGVVCSNHAGRQVDGAIASLDALPDVSCFLVLETDARLSKVCPVESES